jgi:hypothetical protein
MVNIKQQEFQKNEKSYRIDELFTIFSNMKMQIPIKLCFIKCWFFYISEALMYFDQPDERFTRLQSSITGQIFFIY